MKYKEELTKLQKTVKLYIVLNSIGLLLIGLLSVFNYFDIEDLQKTTKSLDYRVTKVEAAELSYENSFTELNTIINKLEKKIKDVKYYAYKKYKKVKSTIGKIEYLIDVYFCKEDKNDRGGIVKQNSSSHN